MTARSAHHARTMHASQQQARMRNQRIADAAVSTPPRDEEAIRAQNREDIEAYKASMCGHMENSHETLR